MALTPQPDGTIYEHFVMRMAGAQTLKSKRDILFTGALGLTGEAGEVADLTKKLVFHDWMPDEFRADFRDKLREELGDVLWYIILLAYGYLGISLEEVIQTNIDKLSNRYPGRLTTRGSNA